MKSFCVVVVGLHWPQKVNLHDLTESALVTASLHVASLSLLGRWVSSMVWEPLSSHASLLSLLGRMPPLHLLLSAAIFLPGQVLLPFLVFIFLRSFVVDLKVRRKCQRISFHSAQHQYQCINAP